MWNGVVDAHAGAGVRGGDQGVREQDVRHAVRPVRQGERERRRRAPALPVAQVAPLGHSRRVRSRPHAHIHAHLFTCSIAHLLLSYSYISYEMRAEGRA